MMTPDRRLLRSPHPSLLPMEEGIAFLSYSYRETPLSLPLGETRAQAAARAVFQEFAKQ
jgi:hypothetical protein